MIQCQFLFINYMLESFVLSLSRRMTNHEGLKEAKRWTGKSPTLLRKSGES